MRVKGEGFVVYPCVLLSTKFVVCGFGVFVVDITGRVDGWVGLGLCMYTYKYKFWYRVFKGCYFDIFSPGKAVFAFIS